MSVENSGEEIHLPQAAEQPISPAGGSSKLDEVSSHKVEVTFQAVGGAPILQRKKWRIEGAKASKLLGHIVSLSDCHLHCSLLAMFPVYYAVFSRWKRTPSSSMSIKVLPHLLIKFFPTCAAVSAVRGNWSFTTALHQPGVSST